MENFVNKAACPEHKIIELEGPFDVCIECSRRSVACSGPRTTAMPHERYVVWMRQLFERWGGTRQHLSDITGVSKSTIDDFFAGRRKDISRTTAGLLEDVLIGGDAKWPCAMLIDSDKEIVYEDRPETLEALRYNMEQNQAKDALLEQKDTQIANLRLNYNEVRDSVDREMTRVRNEYEDDIREYKALVALLREQINRKDDYIDRLAKKAGI